MKAPTDLELMMFADGELDEARSSEVARYLADTSTEEARAKLSTMSMVGELTRREADRLAIANQADLIADAVMKSIAEGALGSSKPEPAKRAKIEPTKVESTRPDAKRGDPTTLKLEPAKVELSGRPANDNQRFIYGIAGIAAAAAIALGFWGRSAPETRTAGREPVVHEIPSSLPLEVAAASSQPPSPSAKPGTVDDAVSDEPTVKVASVDFGANTGAIYYVPRDTPGTTTVVWLADR